MVFEDQRKNCIFRLLTIVITFQNGRSFRLTVVNKIQEILEAVVHFSLQIYSGVFVFQSKLEQQTHFSLPENRSFLFLSVSGDSFSSSARLSVVAPLLYEEKSSFDFSMSITTSGCLLNSVILSLTQVSSEGNNKWLF